MDVLPISGEGCIVRDTAARKGRTLSVAPGRTAARYLHYGRVILEAGAAPLRFETAPRETCLICLNGSALVRLEAHAFGLDRYDALYVPRDTAVEINPGPAGCDLAEIAAPVETRYPVQYVDFDDVRQDPRLHFTTGGPQNRRELNILIGRNVEAGRILAGITFSAPGNWTSWPPHEHAAMLEEAYLYIEMPSPAFGIQLVYTNPREPEIATVVREGDVVLMPQGYHPNVAAPSASINFLWMMAAHREREDRRFGVVNVQPEYAAVASGLESAREERR